MSISIFISGTSRAQIALDREVVLDHLAQPHQLASARRSVFRVGRDVGLRADFAALVRPMP